MLENSERRFYTENDINLPNYTWTEYPVELKGNGMTTTDRNASGRFQIIGTTVFWHVDVNFKGVNFNNTAVMYITVPFPAAVHTDSASGALHDVSTAKTHGLKGHYEQYLREVQLFYVNNQIEDMPLAHNQPVTLATDDYFHICGWYEAVFND